MFKLVLPIIIALILFGGYFALKQTKPTYAPSSKQTASPSPKQDLKTFESKLMKFSINIPKNFSAIDEPSRITIKTDNGQIYINRNGTQFSDLDTYLLNFDQNSNLKTSVDEKLTINSYKARERVFQNSDVSASKEKIYFIYVENFVYKISTSSESLYPILDQIAQSFRYTP